MNGARTSWMGYFSKIEDCILEKISGRGYVWGSHKLDGQRICMALGQVGWEVGWIPGCVEATFLSENLSNRW